MLFNGLIGMSENLKLYGMLADDIYELSSKKVDEFTLLHNIEFYGKGLEILNNLLNEYEARIDNGEIPQHYGELVKPLREELDRSNRRFNNLVRRVRIKSVSLAEIIA